MRGGTAMASPAGNAQYIMILVSMVMFVLVVTMMVVVNISFLPQPCTQHLQNLHGVPFQIKPIR